MATRRRSWIDSAGYHHAGVVAPKEVVCQRCPALVHSRGRQPLCDECRAASRLNRANARRTAMEVTDVTPADVRLLLARARRCPLCSVRLTAAAGLPASKHLDHIVPINVGGLHVLGNVRVVCASCNIGRPLDGSDAVGQLALCVPAPAPDHARLCSCGRGKRRTAPTCARCARAPRPPRPPVVHRCPECATVVKRRTRRCRACAALASRRGSPQTERGRSIVDLRAQGLGYKAIASALGCSRDAVRCTLRRWEPARP